MLIGFAMGLLTGLGAQAGQPTVIESPDGFRELVDYLAALDHRR